MQAAITPRLSSSSSRPDAIPASVSAAPHAPLSFNDILSYTRFFVLTPSALSTLRFIQRFTNHGKQRCYLTDAQIAAGIKCCERTVQYALRLLESFALITSWQKGSKVRVIRYNLDQVVAFGNDTALQDEFLVIPKGHAKSVLSSDAAEQESSMAPAVIASPPSSTPPITVAPVHNTEPPSTAASAPVPASAAVSTSEPPSAVSTPQAAPNTPTAVNVEAVTAPVSSKAAVEASTALEIKATAPVASVAPIAPIADKDICTPASSCADEMAPLAQPAESVSTPEQPRAVSALQFATATPTTEEAITASVAVSNSAPVSVSTKAEEASTALKAQSAAPITSSKSHNTPKQPPVASGVSVASERTALAHAADKAAAKAAAKASAIAKGQALVESFKRSILAGQDMPIGLFMMKYDFYKRAETQFTDRELRDFGLKRDQCKAICDSMCGLPTQPSTEQAPAEQAQEAQRSATVNSASTPSKSKSQPSATSGVSGLFPNLSAADADDADWPEQRHGTLVVNADTPYLEASIDDLLAAAAANTKVATDGQAAHADTDTAADTNSQGAISLKQALLASIQSTTTAGTEEQDVTALLLSLAAEAGTDEQQAEQRPLSATEFDQLPATDPRMVAHNQKPLRLYSAPNSAQLPIHTDLYRFDFTERLAELHLNKVLFWGDTEPQLCFDFQPLAEFLSADHVSVLPHYYSWQRLDADFAQFFRFAVLSELCYYSTPADLFSHPEEAPRLNMVELKEFFATHQQGMLMQWLALALGTTQGPYKDGYNREVLWCSDSLWRSISYKLNLSSRWSPLPYLASCIRRQLVSCLNDEHTYCTLLQHFKREFLRYAQKQQWVKYFVVNQYSSDYMRFIYPANFGRLMHVDFQQGVFRLTYPMLLWRKIACVLATAAHKISSGKDNGGTTALLLLEIAYNQVVQDSWAHFVAAFAAYYPFLTKVGGCEHV